MDKYIYDDINYVIINDNIEYKFEIKKKEKNISSKLGIEYFENIKKVKFPQEGERPIYFNPAYYLLSKEFLEENDYIPFMNLKKNYLDDLKKNQINKEKLSLTKLNIKDEFMQSLIFLKLIKIIFKYSDINIQNCFTTSISVNSLIRMYTKNYNKICFENDKKINKNKKYDFIHIDLYKWSNIVDTKVEKNEYSNFIKMINVILKNLNKGGSIIIYLVSTFNKETINLIHLISSLFKYTFLHKPHCHHYTYNCFLVCVDYNGKNNYIKELINKINPKTEMISIIHEDNNNFLKNEMIINLYNQKCLLIQKKFLNPKIFDKRRYLKSLLEFYSYYLPEYEISEYYINKRYINKIKSFIKNNNLLYQHYNQILVDICIQNNKQLTIISDKFLQLDKKINLSNVNIKPSNKNILINLLNKDKYFDTIVVGDIPNIYNNINLIDYIHLLFSLTNYDSILIINIYKIFRTKNNINISYLEKYIKKNKNNIKLIYKDNIYIFLQKIKPLMIINGGSKSNLNIKLSGPIGLSYYNMIYTINKNIFLFADIHTNEVSVDSFKLSDFIKLINNQVKFLLLSEIEFNVKNDQLSNFKKHKKNLELNVNSFYKYKKNEKSKINVMNDIGRAFGNMTLGLDTQYNFDHKSFDLRKLTFSSDGRGVSYIPHITSLIFPISNIFMLFCPENMILQYTNEYYNKSYELLINPDVYNIIYYFSGLGSEDQKNKGAEYLERIYNNYYSFCKKRNIKIIYMEHFKQVTIYTKNLIQNAFEESTLDEKKTINILYKLFIDFCRYKSGPDLVGELSCIITELFLIPSIFSNKYQNIFVVGGVAHINHIMNFIERYFLQIPSLNIRANENIINFNYEKNDGYLNIIN